MLRIVRKNKRTKPCPPQGFVLYSPNLRRCRFLASKAVPSRAGSATFEGRRYGLRREEVGPLKSLVISCSKLYIIFFRTSPNPFTLEGASPLPLYPPPLRGGGKLVVAETATPPVFWYRGTTRCFFDAAYAKRWSSSMLRTLCWIFLGGLLGRRSLPRKHPARGVFTVCPIFGIFIESQGA